MGFPFAPPQGLNLPTGTADPAKVLSGETFESAGSLVPQTGTMPNNGATNFTPSGNNTVAIPAGYYDGSGVVEQVSVPAADVLTGTTIAGVAGTIPIYTSLPSKTFSFNLTGYLQNATVPGSNTPSATITVGTNPAAVAVNSQTNTVYVANEGSNSVSVIDGATNTVTTTITVGSNPYGVAVNETTNTVYVANEGSNSVSVLD